MPPRPVPLAALIAQTADRFMLLGQPPDQEPSVVADGATCLEWAARAGLTGLTPHETIRKTFEGPLDLGLHAVEDVAHVTLQQLCSRGVVERVGARLPFLYRPRLGAVDRNERRRGPRAKAAG